MATGPERIKQVVQALAAQAQDVQQYAERFQAARLLRRTHTARIDPKGALAGQTALALRPDTLMAQIA
jgi:hypothetical protein